MLAAAKGVEDAQQPRNVLGRMNVVMRDMLSLGTISVRELSEARINVLDLVVRLACTNARQADFEALEANIERTGSPPAMAGCSTASNARASSTGCWRRR